MLIGTSGKDPHDPKNITTLNITNPYKEEPKKIKKSGKELRRERRANARAAKEINYSYLYKK